MEILPFYSQYILSLLFYVVNKKQLFTKNEETITTTFTYLLIAWSRVLEKVTGSAASQQIPRIFGTRRFINILTFARHLSLS